MNAVLDFKIEKLLNFMYVQNLIENYWIEKYIFVFREKNYIEIINQTIKTSFYFELIFLKNFEIFIQKLK